MGSAESKKDDDKKDKKDKKEEKKSQVTELKVQLHCQKCGRKVLKSLSELKEVSAVEVDVSKNKVTVTGTMEAEKLLKKVRKLGKVAELSKDEKSTSPSAKDFTVKEISGYRIIMPAASPNPCTLM